MPIDTPLQPRSRGLIIGASSGIGAALAHRLGSEGYLLALVARREELLRSVCEGINNLSRKRLAKYYQHDVTNYASVPDLLRRIVAELGGLDVVIYVAGVNHPPGPGQYKFETDREMIEVNLTGAIAWLDPIAAMFQSARAGQIVGISSVAGDRGRVGNPAYNASKAGLSTYLEALRNRLTRHGVNVLTVKPGFVKTEMLKAAPKAMFPISPEKVSDDIWKAMKKRRLQIYTPAMWGWIMFVVRNIPSLIFRRMSF